MTSREMNLFTKRDWFLTLGFYTKCHSLGGNQLENIRDHIEDMNRKDVQVLDLGEYGVF
jgi:hypothetical protein